MRPQPVPLVLVLLLLCLAAAAAAAAAAADASPAAARVAPGACSASSGGGGGPNAFAAAAALHSGGGDSGTLAALADVDSDRYVDALLADGAAVRVFAWDAAADRFAATRVLGVLDGARGGGCNASDAAEAVRQVLATDFARVGRSDLLVLTTRGRLLYVSLASPAPARWCEPLGGVNASGLALLLDYNGDMVPDVLLPSGGDARAPTLLLGVGRLGGVTGVAAEFAAPVPLPDAPPGLALLARGTHAFADVNGDCRADLLLVSGDDSGGAYELHTFLSLPDRVAYNGSLRLPDDFGSFTVADMAGIGRADLVVSTSSAVQVWRQADIAESPLASHAAVDTEGAADLCRRDVRVPLYPAAARTEYALGATSRTAAAAAAPQLVVVDDIDGDLAGDILVVHAGRVWVLWSDGVDAAAAAAAALQRSRAATRAGANVDAAFTPLAFRLCQMLIETGDQALVPALVDYDRDGTLDLLVALSNGTTLGYRGVVDADRYFMTFTALNGLCLDCSGVYSTPPLGVNQVGVAFRVELESSTSAGESRVRALHQLVQSAPPHSPTAVVRVRANQQNVARVAAGLPLNRTALGALHASKEWSTTVPNAAMLVVPYALAASDDWALRLFVSPSDKVWAVALGLCIALLISGMLSLGFKCRERQLDRRVKKRTIAKVFF